MERNNKNMKYMKCERCKGRIYKHRVSSHICKINFCKCGNMKEPQEGYCCVNCQGIIDYLLTSLNKR